MEKKNIFYLNVIGLMRLDIVTRLLRLGFCMLNVAYLKEWLLWLVIHLIGYLDGTQMVLGLLENR